MISLLHVVLPLIHPIGPVHLSVSGDITGTEIHINTVEQAIESAFIDTVDAKLHHTFAATSETQLSTTKVASTPVEVADARIVKMEVINTDHSSLEPDDEASPELCV